MYGIIRNVISAGGYKLTDVQHKIKKLYVLGDITETQMDELLKLTITGISPDAERPEIMIMLRTMADQIAELQKQVASLMVGDDIEPDESPADYPAWVPWNGISTNYQHGAVVRHNDQLWQSIHTGQNVWEPGTVGTESLWVEFTPAE